MLKLANAIVEMCIAFLAFIYTWIFIFFFNNDIQIHRLHTQLLTNNKKIHKTGTH